MVHRVKNHSIYDSYNLKFDKSSQLRDKSCQTRLKRSIIDQSKYVTSLKKTFLSRLNYLKKFKTGTDGKRKQHFDIFILKVLFCSWNVIFFFKVQSGAFKTWIWALNLEVPRT